MGFGKEGCEISGRHGVVQELKETLTSLHLDFDKSFCTVFRNFTALFASLTVIQVAAQEVYILHSLQHTGLTQL